METPPHPRKRSRWPFILVCCVLLLVGAAVIIPNFIRARTYPCLNACINNLRQIDGAKEQWALEHNKKEGAPVSKEDEIEINKYIKGGGENLKCPSGEPNAHYSYNAVGLAPTCSFRSGEETHSLTSR